ncbi:MAG: DinB family protein [Cryomorphaceae bacterium]
MDNSDKKRTLDQLRELIPGSQAHVSLDYALSDLTVDIASKVPEGMPYSIWQLLEHIRIAQDDILRFSENATSYKPMKWPDDYWPDEEGPADEASLEKSIDEVMKGLKRMQNLVEERSDSLFTAIPNGDGQTLFREAVLLSQHNAYHIGQIVVLRRILGDWD